MPDSSLMMHTLQVSALYVCNSRQSVPGTVLAQQSADSANAGRENACRLCLLCTH